jgi:two-component system, OmpR family, sensor histidine kinase MprB
MSLRTRLTLLTALSVAAAVVIVSVIAYFTTRDRLLAQVDESLRTRAQEVGHGGDLPHHGPGGPDGGPSQPHDPFAPTDVFFQIIDTSGAIVAQPSTQQTQIPVTSADLAVAARTNGTTMHDATSSGLHLRVITSPGEAGQAVQVARSLAEVDASLSSLQRILFGLSGGGIVLAAVLGLIVAHRSLRPIARLTEATEHVARTQQLDRPIEARGSDELSRLAHSFNAMLQALHESREQQHQLVNDASHELRTPLTSLRTNIDVLIRAKDMSDGEREQIMRDVTFELEELAKLVGELVELASDKRIEPQTFEDVRLDQLAQSVVDRARRRSGLEITLEAAPTLVVGNYNLLDRAAGNLVDNACKWSPSDAAIEVSVAGGVFRVRDHGPGISEQDQPHVFDRFYRSDAARAKPGSGLGLAIVKQIIDAHGGTTWVESAAGGGTIAAFRLSSVPIEVALPSEDAALRQTSRQPGAA